MRGLPLVSGSGAFAVAGLCVSTNSHHSFEHWSRNPDAMQQVGKVATSPDWHFGQTACFSNAVFNDSSSKMPLVAAGFDFLTGVSCSLSDVRSDTIVVDDAGDASSSLAMPADEDVFPNCVFFPRVRVTKRELFPGRFQPEDALSLLRSALVVGAQPLFLLT